MEKTTISVIIPTLNAGKLIGPLLNALERQHRAPDEIIVVDSSSDDNTREIVKTYENVRLVTIDRKDFDHGGTRDRMFRESIGDFVLFLTQDAMPRTDSYVERIVQPFADERVALVYGRQLPRKNATHAERLIREFSYKAQSRVITEQDIPQMGIKAYNSTDVCAAYRRTAYMEVGGFDHPVRTNEDMFIAARLLHAGWKIVYDAEAEVIHSHDFTFRQQYERNYIQGYEIERHRNILGDASLAGEGMAMVRYTMKGLVKQGDLTGAARFFVDCVVRYVGNRKGILDAKRAAKKESSAR